MTCTTRRAVTVRSIPWRSSRHSTGRLFPRRSRTCLMPDAAVEPRGDGSTALVHLHGSSAKLQAAPPALRCRRRSPVSMCRKCKPGAMGATANAIHHGMKHLKIPLLSAAGFRSLGPGARAPGRSCLQTRPAPTVSTGLIRPKANTSARPAERLQAFTQYWLPRSGKATVRHRPESASIAVCGHWSGLISTGTWCRIELIHADDRIKSWGPARWVPSSTGDRRTEVGWSAVLPVTFNTPVRPRSCGACRVWWLS